MGKVALAEEIKTVISPLKKDEDPSSHCSHTPCIYSFEFNWNIS